MIIQHPDDIELSIIAPMYNEVENIEHTINAINNTMSSFPHKWELILVDDGSTDNTYSVAKNFSDKYLNIFLYSYTPNIGRGRALRTGFEHARGRYIITIDFDLSYSPDHILKLYNELKNNPQIDIVLGSAYMKGGKTHGVPFLRLLISRLGNKILQMAFNSEFKTITCILRGYKKHVIDALVLESDTKEIHLEILSKVLALGFKVKEIPATLQKRKKGKSKTTKYTKISITHLIFSIYERPVLIFTVLGIVLILVGFAYGLYITYLRYFGNLNPGRPLFYFIILLVLVGFQLLFFGIIAGQNSNIRNEIYKIQSKLKLLSKEKQEK